MTRRISCTEDQPYGLYGLAPMDGVDCPFRDWSVRKWDSRRHRQSYDDDGSAEQINRYRYVVPLPGARVPLHIQWNDCVVQGSTRSSRKLHELRAGRATMRRGDLGDPVSRERLAPSRRLGSSSEPRAGPRCSPRERRKRQSEHDTNGSHDP